MAGKLLILVRRKLHKQENRAYEGVLFMGGACLQALEGKALRTNEAKF